ncbi:ABC transporter transmembrane region [Globodera pallida]|nr:ABC transporter transmembrane region [Globodera pallida]
MVKRNEMGCVLWTFLFVLTDLSVTFGSICFHGSSPSVGHFTEQLRAPYVFNRSVLDFFVISVLRSLFISLGCAIILCKNVRASRTLGLLSQASFGLCILLCSFSPTKFLALSDNSGPDHPGIIFSGDIALLLANFSFAIIAHRLWLSFLHTAQCNENVYERLEEEEGEGDEEEGSEQSLPQNGPVTTDVRTFVIILRLLQYCRNEWLWHLSGFTWLFIYSLTRIFIPYFTGQVIASVVSSSGDKYGSLVSSVKLMLFISVISAIAGGFRGGSFEYAYSRFFASLVRQDVAFFDRHKTGEITSRLTADTTTMSDTIALNVNIFLRNTVQMGGSMLFMMALCWRLSLVPFIVVPIILVASKIFGIYYDFLSEKVQEAVAHSNDVAEEVLSTMRTVRSFACEEFESIRFYDKLTITMTVTKRKAVAYVAFLWVSELFQTIINVAVLWYGGHLVLTGQLQKDLLVSFLLYQMQLADNIRQLGEVWTGLMQSVGASRKVFEYIDRKSEIDTKGNYAPDKLEGRIEFQNVHFSYPTRPDNPILRGLSFTVEPGEVVALVGPSGSGKSSCIALLEHFYAPEGGKVLVDGVPIREFDHQYIHNKVALVGQEPVLFGRSVAENIAYGVERCTIVDVVEAAKMANAHAFIQQTRDQYDTNVGEQGSQMSEGKGAGSEGKGPDQKGKGPDQKGKGPDQKGKGPDQKGKGPDQKGKGPDQKGKGPDQKGKGPDQKGKGPDQKGKGPDQKGKGPDQKGKGPDQKGKGPDQKGRDRIRRERDRIRRERDRIRRERDRIRRERGRIRREGTGSEGKGTGSEGKGTGSEGKGAGSEGKGPDQKGKGPDQKGKGPDQKGKGPDQKGKGPDQKGKGPDQKGKGPDQKGKGPDQKGKGPDQKGKGPDQKGKGPDQKGKGPDQKGKGPDQKGKGPDQKGKGPDQKGKGPDQKGKGPDQKGKGPDQKGKGPDQKGKGPDQKGKGPDQKGKGPDQKGKGPDQKGKGPDQKGKGPDQKGKGPDQKGKGPDQKGKGPDQKGKGPDQKGKGPDQKGKGPDQKGKGPDQKGKGPDQKGKGPDQKGKGPDQKGKGPDQKGKGPDQKGKGPDQKGKGPDQKGKGPDQKGKGPDQKGKGPDQKGKGPDQKGKGPDQKGKGPDQKGKGPDQKGKGPDQKGKGPDQKGKPAILLLDEATSALDTESEHLVQEAIYKNLKGRSVILIAHRLSTVEKADKIVVMSRGRLEQIGTHEQLLAQEGMYRSLVQRQMITVGDNGGELELAECAPSEGQEETLSAGGGGTDETGAGPSGTRRWSRTRIVSGGRGGSPRTMAQSLLATSFTQSTSSLQSK